MSNSDELTPTQYRKLLLDLHPDYLYHVYGDIQGYSPKYFEDWRCGGGGATVRNSAFYPVDCKRRSITVQNGLRITDDSPPHYKNHIHLLGASHVFGAYVADKHTIASYLQRLCNKHFPSHWRVINHGIDGCFFLNAWLQLRYAIPKIGLWPGDSVILIERGVDRSGRSFAEYVQHMELYCRQRQCNFLTFLWLRIGEIISPFPMEKKLALYSYKELYEEAVHDVPLPPKEYPLPPRRALEKTRSVLSPYPWFYDLQSELHWSGRSGEIFWDKVHVGSIGNKLTAEVLFRKLSEAPFCSGRPASVPLPKPEAPDVLPDSEGTLPGNTSSHAQNKACSLEQFDLDGIRYLQEEVPRRLRGNKGIHRWVANVPRFSKQIGTVGVIVMNCNPMTLGHVHCIQEALRHVDALYIFVVEEDRSFFPFKDRFELVKTVCAQRFKERVCVAASGSFIISSFSFPGYFSKEVELSGDAIDSSLDIAIFGAILAPALRVTHRFVGEEPLCPVTREYNQIMLNLLPPMGIEVRVFPRKQAGEEPISASRVRALLQLGDLESIRDLVPQNTYEYLLHLRLLRKPSISVCHS